MKKKAYYTAVACVAIATFGFAGIFAVDKVGQKKPNQNLASEMTTETEHSTYQVSSLLEPKKNSDTNQKDTSEKKVSEKEEKKDSVAQASDETNQDHTDVSQAEGENSGGEDQGVAPVDAAANVRHFNQDKGIIWPVKGNVLLPYSMENTIYFPTMEEYRYHDAMVIDADVNDEVKIAAPGVIKEIYENEETGLTVVEDLGDGYTAVYGQLKDLNFAVGDEVLDGHVIGYITEPSKYYSTEGPNLYFAMKNGEESVNPLNYIR